MNITFSRLIKYVFNRKYVIWFLLFLLYYTTHPILFGKNDLLPFHFDIKLYQKQLFKILLFIAFIYQNETLKELSIITKYFGIKILIQDSH